MAALTSSIAIIGAGSVGSAIAYSLLLRRIASSLILVDIDTALCSAQVQDLSDATFLSSVRISAGTAADARNCDIIVVSAGAKQKPGDTRLDLIERNYKVLKSVIKDLKPIRKDAILLIVANPVDVLTLFAQRMSGLPREQVLGSGTLLDSIRLKNILAKKIEVSDSSIHAFVIGEHGDSQCVPWSIATVQSTPLLKVLPLTEDEKVAIQTETRTKAENIIKVKGFTSYGVAAATTRICEAILYDHRQVMPLSHYQEKLGCCLSLPAIVGRQGVVGELPLFLNEKEEAFLAASASSLRAVVEKYGDEEA